METKRTRHAAYNINYHFVWIPKYRRKVLTGKVPERLIELLKEKSTELDGEILNVTVQVDQVHLFARFRQRFPLTRLCTDLKGTQRLC